MKKLSFLMAILPMLFCACSSFNEENNALIIPATPDLQAGFAEDTRTYVENNKYLRWHEDDRLTAFYGNTLNRQYKFNGKTGDNSGTFSLVPSGELGTGNAFDRIYAVYPYNETATITDEGEISLILPAVQNYAENSFGKGANTMIAVTENLEDTFLAFKNACGYLKLKLYNADGATIKSIEIKGNNNEKIAGAATATIAFGEAPQLKMTDDATTSITLDCGEGVTLATTAETATEFWMVVPEMSFENGITVVVTEIDGVTYEQSTEKKVVIVRNNIQPMSVIEIPTIYRVSYTTNDGQPLDPYTTEGFGANYVENIYDATTGNGLLKFDGKITTIPEKAFIACGNLTHINLPVGITTINAEAFNGCSKLTIMDIPQGVKTIGNKAFYNCSGVTEITVPSSVTYIGTSSFEGCGGKATINCKIADASEYLYGKFYNAKFSQVFIDCSEYIGSEAFSYCKELTNVVISDSVPLINSSAFYGCDSLTSVTIGNSVTRINSYAFAFCRSLTSVTIPDSVISIGNSTFYCCSSLISVTIPDSVTSIGNWAFSSCSSLTSVTIPDSVTEIKEGVFYKCSSLTSITIPNRVTEIGNKAFYGCSNLTSVTIPNRVTLIENATFEGCSSLTSITIPDGITSIGECAFYGCSSLTSITIPKRVVSIGASAFYGCNNLTSLYCVPITPPTISSGIFKNPPIIYVSQTSADAYKESWSTYKYYITYDGGNIPHLIGDLVTINNVKGVIFHIGDSIKIVSIDENDGLKWSSNYVITNAKDDENGANNMAVIKAISGWEEKYPAFKWCTDYGADWYLPAYYELKEIHKMREIINATLLENELPIILDDEGYWSSTQRDMYNAYCIYNDNKALDIYKYYIRRVRAVLAFENEDY